MKAPPEERLSAGRIQAIQESAWAETYRYVFAHSPYYREQWRRAGCSPRRPVPLDQLCRLPTVDKALLSRHAPAFLCVPPEKIVDILTTSGSTGQPLVWKLSEADLERLALNEALSFRCAGFTSRDTVILAVTLDRCFIAGLAYYLGLRKLGCSLVRVGPATPLMHLDMLQRTRATAVVGVPSFLNLLAEKAAEVQRPVSACGVRKLVCIGEPIRNQDFTLNPAGQRLERRWKAKVYSTYGVTELAASFCECEAGRGGHLHPSVLFVEVLDEAGQPVPDGQVGEVTATTFGVEAMPLVRYRTGDFAALHRGPCPCGRRTPRLGPIVGRKHHKLKIKGTTLFPSTLQTVLESVAEVRSYAIIARRGDPLSDRVEVKVACAGDPAKVLRLLRERFQGEAKVVPQLAVASPSDIESLQMPDAARKRRWFVDLRD